MCYFLKEKHFALLKENVLRETRIDVLVALISFMPHQC